MFRRNNRLQIPPPHIAGNSLTSGIGLILLRRLYRLPRVCSVALLLRSFCGHIDIHNKRRLWMTGVDSGPAWGIDASGHSGPDIRTHARMKDTQKLCESFPWASLVDSLIFLEGWDKGAEWASGNPWYGNRSLGSKTSASYSAPSGDMLERPLGKFFVS